MQLDSLGSRGQPMLYQGLLPLPYPAAVSAWDDPSYLTIEYEKSPHLLDWITFQIVHIARNVLQTAHYFELFSIFSIAVIGVYAIHHVGERFRTAGGAQDRERKSWWRQLRYALSQHEGTLHDRTFYALIVLVVYTVGYELLHIETEYVWIDAMLLLLLCASFVCDDHFHFIRSAKLQHVLFYVMFFSFWLYPVMLLITHAYEDKDIYMTSRQLQTAYHVKGNIAANNDGDANNSWGLALYYTYFLDSDYYGTTQRNISDDELQRELGKYHIDYYFVWNGACRLSECRKIAEFEIRFLWMYQTKHLVVYQIKQNSS